MRKYEETINKQLLQESGPDTDKAKALRLAHSPSYLFYDVRRLMHKLGLAIPQIVDRRVSFMFHDKYAVPMAAEMFASVILLRQKILCPDEEVRERDWIAYTQKYMRR